MDKKKELAKENYAILLRMDGNKIVEKKIKLKRLRK